MSLLVLLCSALIVIDIHRAQSAAVVDQPVGPSSPLVSRALQGPGQLGQQQQQQECPQACFCNILSHIVYCSRRGLGSIPLDVPVNTVQLNLNGNEFATSVVDRRNFSSVVNLEHLYMSECRIEKIAVDTFADLKALRWLDLSNNRIKMIEDETFRGVNLQHLFLNGNRHIQLQVGSFNGLATTGLYLHDCSLADLSADVLVPLNTTVRYLWLNGNELTCLDRRLEPLFAGLQHLRLGANPLQCDCSTAWLKHLFDASPEIFRGSPAPSCRGPSRMRSMSFNGTSVDQFSCISPQFTRAEVIFNGTVGRLACAASGDPAPTVYWIQPSGRATRHDVSGQQPLQQQQQQQPVVKDDRARYSNDDGIGENEGVLTVDTADASNRFHGMYICIANNAAGNVTLTINLPPAGTPLHRLLSIDSLDQSATQPMTSSSSTVISVPPTTTLPVFRKERYPDVRADRRTADQMPVRGSNTAVGDEDGKSPVPRRTHRQRTGTAIIDDAPTGRLFTLSELVGAVVGTHIATLLFCLLVVWLCYATRCISRFMQRRARRIYERRLAAAAACGGGVGGHGSSSSYADSSVETLCVAGGGVNGRGNGVNADSYCNGDGVGCGGGLGRHRGGKLTSPHASPPPEAVYLNGLGHLPYMDYVDLRNGRLSRR